MAELSGHQLAVRMAELARTFAPPPGVEEVLEGVTSAAVELIPGADMAGVLLAVKNGKFESLVHTNDLVRRLDEVQARQKEGPCLDAATDELVIRADDFAHETRWPKFARAAITAGVHSSLSFRLYGSTQTAGALNVFGSKPNVFTSESEAIGLVLASHAAAAILASRQGEQLQSAVASRDTIGQAKGIIMERFNVDAVRAFELLRQLSQTDNVPLDIIAQRVIDTRGD
jgi:GAF domain-containing protein